MKCPIPKKQSLWPVALYYALRFWPLILAGRLMARVVLNLWDMLEP